MGGLGIGQPYFIEGTNVYLHIVHMNLFQLTRISHNMGFSRNQYGRYAGNRCTSKPLSKKDPSEGLAVIWAFIYQNMKNLLSFCHLYLLHSMQQKIPLNCEISQTFEVENSKQVHVCPH